MVSDRADIESMMITLLQRDARMSLTDLSERLGVTRVTASKVLRSLLEKGRIRRFTVITDMDEGDMVLLRTRDPESVPDSCVVERLDLLGEESLVLIRPECLRELSGQGHLAIEYVKKRYVYSFSPVRGVKCDYCGKFIDGKPIEVEFMGRTLYACCTNCERDLRRRVEGVEVR